MIALNGVQAERSVSPLRSVVRVTWSALKMPRLTRFVDSLADVNSKETDNPLGPCALPGSSVMVPRFTTSFHHTAKP